MIFFRSHHAKRLLPLLLSLCILLSACSGGNQTSPGQNTSQTADSQKFAEFTDTLFRESVCSDALSLNYTLANPEDFGVAPSVGGFAPISYEALKNAAPESENLIVALENFDKDKLTLSQQILYDSLLYTLQMDEKSSEFILFSRPLSPVTGLQAQLPVLLAEYNFNSVTDIENYFALLESIPDYFTSVLAFMDIQAKQNLLPCQSTLENIRSQCQTFLGNNGKKILITSFKKRAKSCSFLDTSTRKTYCKMNKDLVNSCIVPAYTELVSGLEKLAPLCGTDGSLASLENGKAYYEYLFALESGSDMNPTEYFKILNEQLNTSKETLVSYAKKDPSLFSNLNTQKANQLSPEEQLTALSQAIETDFPKASDVNFTVSYVDKSLEDYLSPAFYLTPPLDAFTENAIYINGSSRYAGSDLSTTLAHEGYPGHLYQNVYCRQQNLPLLSYALNFGGYTEGWATYAELYSYKYLGYTEDEIGILRNNMTVSLCIYAICDIGIHYYGWDVNQVLSFLNQNGSYSAETAQSLYTNIVDEPGSYLKYTIGYMEFLKLKKAAKKQLGKNYSEMAFHTFVLSTGPAPFPVLLDYMGKLF